MATNQNEIDQAIQNLIKMGVKIMKVYQNASPTSAFKGQAIDVELQDADFVMITWRYSTTGASLETLMFDPAQGGYLRELAGAGYSNVGYCSRYVEFTPQKITFNDNYLKNINTSTGGTVNNNYQIPVTIYAVKGVI